MYNSRIVFLKTVLSSAVVAAIATATPVVAQDSDRTMVLEEVTVTAQKRSESLQDTPISITAFGVDELQNMGVFEAGQIANYTPNLQINRQPSSMDNYGYGIRGVSNGETALLVEPTVGMYVDGIYIARSTGAVFDVVDLERIEILRGPQGTLYGRNTIGGAINLITEKPLEEFAVQQKFTVGNRGFLRSTTTVDTGMMGNFSARLTYNYNEKDGLVRNIVHGNKLGEQESKAFRAAVRWVPTDNVTVDYSYDESDRDSNAALSQLVHVRRAEIAGAITQQAAAMANENRLDDLSMAFSSGVDSYSDIESHTLTLEWDINASLTFKSITSSRDWGSGTTGTDFGSFMSDGATVLNGIGGLIPAGEYVPTFRAERLSDNEQFTQEFQLLGDAFDDKLLYTLGVYYFEEESNEDNPQWFVLPAEIAYGRLDQGTKSFLCMDPTFQNPYACIGKDTLLSSPIFQYGSDNESRAVYGQFTYAMSDQLDVTFGVRYSEDDKKAYLRNSSINGGETTSRAKDDWSNTSTALTLNYAWNDEMRTYVTVSQGYRSGGFNARANNADDFSDGFDEETVVNYEIGMKSDWLDSRVRLNAALFYLEYDDAQISSFKAGEGGASSFISNAGELESKGLEIEFTALLTDGLRLDLNYGYTDAEYKKYISQRVDPVSAFPSPGPDADPLTGNEDISDVAEVGRTPEHNASAILTYDFQPFSFGQLQARVDATYVSEMSFHPQLVLYDVTDDQTLINARLTLSEMNVLGGNLTLSAWGRNLADEKYREWGIDFGVLGIVIDSFQERRSYGVDLIYRYGR